MSHGDTTFSASFEVFAQALRTGRIQPAAAAFNEMAGQSAETAALAIQLRNLLTGMFDHFQLAPLAAFVPWLAGHPAASVAAPAVQAVRPRLEEAERWRRTLGDIGRERRGRDLRALVRSRDVAGAVAVVRGMLTETGTGEHRFTAARQLGVILGSMGADRPRCEQILDAVEKNPAAFALEPAHVAALRQTYGQTQTSLSMTEMATHERQWDRLHTEAVVDLMRRLPGPGATSARPGSEEEIRFYSSLHAAVAGFFLADAVGESADDRSARFLDLARILHEFCPADARVTGPIEGVEDVAFQRISATDRLVAVRALRRLGGVSKVVETVTVVSRFCTAGRAHEILLSLMGGLSSEDFLPQLAAALQDRRVAKMHDSIVDALGRVGGERAQRVLQEVLVELLGSRVFDPPLRQRIATCLAALGRIARHPDTSAATRNAIVLQAMKALPEDRGLGRAALEHFFSWNPAALSSEAKEMAVRFAVDNLWVVEAHSRLAKATPNQKTELGAREPLTKMLIAMGQPVLPAVLEAAERHAIRYSAGILALAEVLAKIGDPSALGLLGRLLNLAVRTDDTAIPEHLRESYYDGAAGEFRPLTRDKVVHGLAYAVHAIGGPAGMTMLRQLASRVKRNEVDSPGEGTMTFLARVIVEADTAGSGGASGQGRGGAGAEAVEPAFSLEDELSGEHVFGAKSAPQSGLERRARQDEDIESLLKSIRSRGLFSSKFEQRVSAIQEVAARQAVEAIAVLCDALGDKEKMLAAAAESAVFEIARPRDPDQRRYREALYSLLEAMRKADGKKVKRVSLIVDRLQPERDPTRTLLLRYIEVEPDERLKKDVADIFRIANERLARSGRSVDLSVSSPKPRIAGIAAAPAAEPAQADDDIWQAEPAPLVGGPTVVADKRALGKRDPMAIKREYFAARQAWAAGGKKGPEPPRPKGL